MAVMTGFRVEGFFPEDAGVEVALGGAGETAEGVCGALITGLGCGGTTGGLGAKNLIHRRMTSMESSEAPRILISGDFTPVCCGALTNAPRPESGRSQICEKRDDSGRGASCQAKCRAARRSARWLHRHIENKSVGNGNFRRRAGTGTLCKNVERGARLARDRSARFSFRMLRGRRSRILQQPQQIGGQRGMIGTRHDVLRMNDNVPSWWYLQTMTTNGLPQATTNTIAHYRAAESLFNAEAEAALRQLIGAKKNNEKRAGTPSAGAIDRVEISTAHQARVARKLKAWLFIRA